VPAAFGLAGIRRQERPKAPEETAMKPYRTIVPAIFTMLGYKSVDPGSFRPDSHERDTIAHAEASYKDFTYNGPGWYPHQDYLLLVVPAVQVDKAGGSGVDLVPWIDVTEAAPIDNPEQLFWFFSFPPLSDIAGWPNAMETFAYIASLPFHGQEQRATAEVIASRSLDDVEGGKPIEVHIQPGTRLRIVTADSDGAFDVTYDYNGDGRLVISADLPGNVLGLEGPLYVEDFQRDTTGLEPDKSVLMSPEQEAIASRLRAAVLAILPTEGSATAESIHTALRKHGPGLVADAAGALATSGLALTADSLAALVASGLAEMEGAEGSLRLRYRRQTSIDTPATRSAITAALAGLSGAVRYSATEVYSAMAGADQLEALVLLPVESARITALAALLTKMGDEGILDFDTKEGPYGGEVGAWRLAPARTPSPFHVTTAAAEKRAELSDRIILIKELRAAHEAGTIVPSDVAMLAHLEEWLLSNPTVATGIARATLADIEALRSRPASPPPPPKPTRAQKGPARKR